MANRIHLIVNADDFGYFGCISRGIAAAAQLGRVTATGVLATSPDLARDLTWLEPHGDVDVGVHLNLTWGLPLTRMMVARLARWDGRFQNLMRMAVLILGNRIEPEVLRGEWRSQIERCLRLAGSVAFVNSHQHIHMLPPLFRLLTDLAREYGIPTIRVVRGGRWAAGPIPALVRSAVLGILTPLIPVPRGTDCPKLIGLNESGRLNDRSLEQLLRRLKPGGIYELMCHPGYFDASEISDRRLIAYHDWNGEYAALTSPSLMPLLEDLGICLTNYRSLASIGSTDPKAD
jgi:hypothetical protein